MTPSGGVRLIRATRACFVRIESEHALDSLVWSHFLRRTGAHFGGKCSSITLRQPSIREVPEMQCGACGRDNRQGRKFCAFCGAALGWACAHCSFVNDAGEDFCGGCGRPPSAEAAKPAEASETESAGERRQVAVLFADLCGFTALSRRLDAEDLRQLVEAFYARADAVVVAYGGTVDKHMGDAVMALFGAPVAHGDDALRAVGAALDIAAATGEIAGPDGAPLAAHMGIAMGEVVAGGIGRGYTVLGDAVNL